MNKYKILKNRNVAVFLPEFSNFGVFSSELLSSSGPLSMGFCHVRSLSVSQVEFG